MRSALVFFAPINRSGWATDGSNSSSYSKRNTENRGKRESSYRVGSATQWKSTNEREISLSQFIILPATVVINRSLRFNFGQGFRLGVSVKPTWSLATTRNVEFKRVILEELERVQTRTRNFSTKGEIGGTSRIAGFSRIREFVLRDRRERFRLNVIYLLHSHETDREKGRGEKRRMKQTGSINFVSRKITSWSGHDNADNSRGDIDRYRRVQPRTASSSRIEKNWDRNEISTDLRRDDYPSLSSPGRLERETGEDNVHEIETETEATREEDESGRPTGRGKGRGQKTHV